MALQRSVRLVLGTVLVVSPAQAQWRVDPRPILDITGTDSAGNVLIGVPAGAARLSDGTIAVADRPAGQLRFFSPIGNLLRTAGHTGRGPGEFVAISWLGQCGADSLHVWDLAQRRLSVIAGSGQVVRQIGLPIDPSEGPPPFVLACSPTGVLAMLGPPSQRPAPGEVFFRGLAPLKIANTAGAITRRVGDVPAGEFALLGGGAGPRPLGKTTSIAVSGDYLMVGTGDSAAVDLYRLSDLARSTISVGTPPRSPTDRHKARGADPSVALAPAAMRAQIRERLLALPFPERLPPYSALFADPTGVFWVQTSVPGDGETRLRAFTPDGRRVADVVLPGEVVIYEIGLDYVLGSYESSDGEPHVAMYHLSRNQ